MTDEFHDDPPMSDQPDDLRPMEEPTRQFPAGEPTAGTPTAPTPPVGPPPANPGPPIFRPPNVMPPNPWAPTGQAPNLPPQAPPAPTPQFQTDPPQIHQPPVGAVPGPSGWQTPTTWGSAAQGWPPPPPPPPGVGGAGMGAPPPGDGNWNYSYGPGSWGPPPGAARPPAAARRTVAAVAVVLLVLASAGVGAAISSAMHTNNNAGNASGPLFGGLGSNNGGVGFPNVGGNSSGTASGGQPSSALVTKVDPAVVDVYTTINSAGSQGEAAGTGMILTSSGEVLTNNHVIDGASTIRVQIAGMSGTRPADVVGYDVVDDVALIKVEGVSGLPTVSFANASNIQIGDSVVAIGNAGGRGGTPAATQGSVTALDQKVTAGDEGTGDSETLHGMIQMSAPIQPGDSGGPLVNADGKVVGMDTAAAQSDDFFGQSGSSTAFAIPINNAKQIVDQIQSGNATTSVHIGDRGVLGVDIGQSGLTSPTAGAPVAQVEPGSPAESAGLARGDVITSVDGKSVSNASDLTKLMFPYHPNDRVGVVWVDQSGQQHQETLKLVAGPPT